ncbi:MAG: hypothetical protein Tp172DCM1112201_24 [Prokaryotic dsDNA virus sp.]|nr:MAG: hypothetical protein Tp172DCM1112201_24 [Prokaryotic dsDNA virus sp.]|tara:strand:+ start:3256 stop:3453 length:198 start_codon:yes stop_codon:yes gene_type:complete
MATAKESMEKIAAHERECAIRYANIEKRLDKGDAKFDAMDAKFTRYILGLYILIIAASGVERIFS